MHLAERCIFTSVGQKQNSGERYIPNAEPTGFHFAIQLCRLAALHNGGSHFCFGDQNHEGGSEVEENDSPAAHTDREKESTLVQKTAHSPCRLRHIPGFQGIPRIHNARICRGGRRRCRGECMDKGQ